MRKRIFSVLLCLCMALTLLPVSAQSAETTYTLSTAVGGYTVTGGTLTSSTTYDNLTNAVAAIITDSSGTADITFDNLTESENKPLTISTACDLTFRGSLTFTNVNTAITLDAENIHIHNYAVLSSNGAYLLVYANNNTSFEQVEGSLTGGVYIGTFSGAVTTSSLAVKGGTINGTVSVYYGSAMTMDGGTINGTKNGSIRMYGASSFVMNNGTITDIASMDVNAVYSGTSTCSVTINGGKIYAENTAASSSWGTYAIYNCGGSIKLAGTVDISAKETSGNSASVSCSDANNFTTIDASGVTGFTNDFTFGPSASAMGSLSARAVWMSGTAGNIDTLVSKSKLKVIGDTSGTYTSYIPAAYGTGVVMKNPSASFSQITAGDITEATFTQGDSNITVSYKTGGATNTASYTDTSITNVTEDVLAADTTPGCDLIYGAKDKTQSVTGDLKLDTGNGAVINLYGKLSGKVDVIGTGTVTSYLDAGGFTGKTKSQINLMGGTVSGTGAKTEGVVEYGVLYLTDANLVVNGATVEATGGDAVVAIGTSNVTLQSGTIKASGYGVYMTRPSGGGTGGKLTVSGGSITSTGSIGALLNIKVDFGMSGGSITGSIADLSVQKMSDSSSAKTFTITGPFGLQKISIMNASNPVIFDVTGATLPSGKSISVTYNEMSSKQLFRASTGNYKDFLKNTTATGGSFNIAVQNAQPVKDSPTTVDLYAAASDKTAQVQFFDSASAASPFYTENLYIGSYLSDVKPTATENFDGWKNASGTNMTDAQISGGTSLYPIYSTSLTASGAKNITATGAEIDLATNGNVIFCTTHTCATADDVVENQQQTITPSSGSAVLKLTGLTPGIIYTYYMAARNANNALSALVTVTFTTEKQTPEASNFAVTEDSGLVYNGAVQEVKAAPSSPYGTINTGDITVSYIKVKDGFGNTVAPGQTISEPVEAGTYEIYITTAGGTTFKAITAPLMLGEYTIAQKALTVTANAQSITYGGSIATAVGNATAATLANGDTLDSVTLTAAGTSVADGGTITPSTAVIKNSGTDVTANYAITYAASKLTITKSTPTLAFGSYLLGYTYSGEAVVNPTESQLTLSGALYKDVVFTWYIGSTAAGTPLAGAPKNAGTYVVTAFIPATDNTNASEIVTSGTITVSPKSLTPTIELPGGALTYDRKSKTPAVTVKDNTAVIPDTEYTVSYTENTAAGMATVTVTDKEGGNYAITKTDDTFTINRAAVTVKPQSFSITIGNTAPTLALAYTGVFSGDTITPSAAPAFKLTKGDGTEIAIADAVKTAGTYTITWSNMAGTNFDAATNYTVTKTETGTLTVSASSSSSGSSSRSSSTVTVPVSSNSGKVNVSASISGSTATVSMTDAQIKEIVSGSERTGIVKLDVSGLKVDMAVVPAAVISAVGAASGSTGLAVILPTGTVTLDEIALAAVAGKGDMKLSVETVDNSKLTDTQKSTLGAQAETAFVVDVNVYAGGNRTSTFGDGKITVSVPYTLKSGENSDSITVWFINDDGSIEPKTASYVNGKVTFTTEHLSQYLIVNFPFTDVAESAWCYGSVAYAYDNGLFSGTSATTFSPNATTNRQMIWMVLARMDGKTPANMAEAKAWAVENGISDGSNPTGTVTRQQMAAILYRYAQLKGYDITQGGMTIREFSDYSSISVYAQPALAWAVNAGLVQGRNNQIMPWGNATRAQVATILQRFCQKAAK